MYATTSNPMRRLRGRSTSSQRKIPWPSARASGFMSSMSGREVKGFPKRWSNGFSAFAFDYDKTANSASEGSAERGSVRDPEGRRIPLLALATIRPAHRRLSHLRIGPRDYIFAAGRRFVRILSRMGEDRFRSPVRVPVGQRLYVPIGQRLRRDGAAWTMKGGCKSERLDR